MAWAQHHRGSGHQQQLLGGAQEVGGRLRMGQCVHRRTTHRRRVQQATVPQTGHVSRDGRLRQAEMLLEVDNPMRAGQKVLHDLQPGPVTQRMEQASRRRTRHELVDMSPCASILHRHVAMVPASAQPASIIEDQQRPCLGRVSRQRPNPTARYPPRDIPGATPNSPVTVSVARRTYLYRMSSSVRVSGSWQQQRGQSSDAEPGFPDVGTDVAPHVATDLGVAAGSTPAAHPLVPGPVSRSARALPHGAIRAAASGRVLERYYNSAYGNRLIINHGVRGGRSVVTTYNHMIRPALKDPGTRVNRGEIIGYSGTTGMSTGCHLHWMAIANGQTINPMSLF